jgi:hypothetical protein
MEGPMAFESKTIREGTEVKHLINAASTDVVAAWAWEATAERLVRKQRELKVFGRVIWRWEEWQREGNPVTISATCFRTGDTNGDPIGTSNDRRTDGFRRVLRNNTSATGGQSGGSNPYVMMRVFFSNPVTFQPESVMVGRAV